ncbi:hypothetical protein ACVH9Z_36575 [Rhodococcus opacus]|uniref:hypothetical protein n=1 Tax=Rhodococcus opacus TaxID=37919 RepID=UPI001FEFE89D|nr:hypothetical protein [Rhodococcus opacus]
MDQQPRRARRARDGAATVETTSEAETEWLETCEKIASYTVFPKTPSWIFGANIPGKKQGMFFFPGLLRVDVFFMSTPAIIGDVCFHQHHETVQVKRAMFEAAQKRVLYADHTKFDQRALHAMAPCPISTPLSSTRQPIKNTSIDFVMPATTSLSRSRVAGTNTPATSAQRNHIRRTYHPDRQLNPCARARSTVNRTLPDPPMF